MAAGIRAVIFDIDGTLIDSVDGHARAWQAVLARHGREVAFPEIRHQIGKGGDQILDAYLPKDVVEREGKDIEKERLELFQREYLPNVRAFPKVRELFERVRAAGLRTALATSAKAEELEKHLKIAGVADLVEEATSSDDADRSKPHPDIFEAALARLGDVAPGEAVAIGDTPYDAQAAGKAGVRTVGLLCGGFPEAELRESGCVAVYRDPADLLEHFEDSPLSPR